MSVSVLIITYNEETNLPRCLESVSWCDDVVVFDSFSTDRTVEIARAAGASVVQNRFEDYGSQREAARTTVPFKYPWVLAVDADEMPDVELVAEVREVAGAGSTTHAAYRMRRKDHFMGRWVRYSTLYPSWFVRFFRHDRIRYEPRSVHEYPAVDGSVGELRGHLLHHSFGKGFHEWIAKHRRYAKLEAAAEHASLRDSRSRAGGLFSFDPVRRLRAFKELSFRMPARPFLRFFYKYFLRLGCLDGWPGFRYCRLMAWYEGLIAAHLAALGRGERAGGPDGPRCGP